MNSEILSIDTITKMVQLEAENKELKETIVKVIDDANTYLKKIKTAIIYIKSSYDENENVLTHTFDKDNLKELFDILRLDNENR